MNTDFGDLSSFEIFFISFELYPTISVWAFNKPSLSHIKGKNQSNERSLRSDSRIVAAEQHSSMTSFQNSSKWLPVWAPIFLLIKFGPNDKIPTQEVSCVGFDIPAIQFLREKRRKNFVMNSENSPSQSSYKKNRVVLANLVHSRHLYKRNFFARDF